MFCIWYCEIETELAEVGCELGSGKVFYTKLGTSYC